MKIIDHFFILPLEELVNFVPSDVGSPGSVDRCLKTSSELQVKTSSELPVRNLL